MSWYDGVQGRNSSLWCCSDGSPGEAEADRRSCTCQRPGAHTQSGRCQAGPPRCRRSKASAPCTCNRRFPLREQRAIRPLCRSSSGKNYEQSWRKRSPRSSRSFWQTTCSEKRCTAKTQAKSRACLTKPVAMVEASRVVYALRPGSTRKRRLAVVGWLLANSNCYSIQRSNALSLTADKIWGGGGGGGRKGGEMNQFRFYRHLYVNRLQNKYASKQVAFCTQNEGCYISWKLLCTARS